MHQLVPICRSAHVNKMFWSDFPVVFFVDLVVCFPYWSGTQWSQTPQIEKNAVGGRHVIEQIVPIDVILRDAGVAELYVLDKMQRVSTHAVVSVDPRVQGQAL